MKKTFLIFCFITSIVLKSYSTVPVAIVTEGIGSIMYYLEAVAQYIDVINNGAKTIALQIKAFEKLGEGGFAGFQKYLDFQGKAIGSFSGTVNSLNSAQFFDLSKFDINIGKTDWMKDFKANVFSNLKMEQVLQDMTDMFNQLVSVAANTKYFAENTEKRMTNLADLVESSKNAESPVAQSEIMLQALSIIAAQNEDQIQLGMNAAALDGNKEKYVETATEYLFTRAKEENKKSSIIGSANPFTHYEDDIKYYKQQIESLWR